MRHRRLSAFTSDDGRERESSTTPSTSSKVVGPIVTADSQLSATAVPSARSRVGPIIIDRPVFSTQPPFIFSSARIMAEHSPSDPLIRGALRSSRASHRESLRDSRHSGGVLGRVAASRSLNARSAAREENRESTSLAEGSSSTPSQARPSYVL